MERQINRNLGRIAMTLAVLFSLALISWLMWMKSADEYAFRSADVPVYRDQAEVTGLV